MALDKPAGLIVHSDGRTQEPSLAQWLLREYPALERVGEPWISPQGERVLLPGIVHRLDRTTSGVIIVAKTPEMYAYLKNEFKERRVEKVYRAFVYGHMETAQGKIVAEIMRTKKLPRKWYARACEETDNRAAITEWSLIKHLADPNTGEPASYVEVRPLTGRTHQIRVHFASIGHPIVADHLYRGDRASSEEVLRPAGRMCFARPALHAYSISLVLKGKKETFVAPLPDDFNIA